VEDNSIVYSKSEIITSALEAGYSAQSAEVFENDPRKTYAQYKTLPFNFDPFGREGPDFTPFGLGNSMFRYGDIQKTDQGLPYQLL
jgi:hypothetical protein